jgi:acyl transferase domain-containing protein/NAD(P)H-dependent flavin oxidoreductase YrpB (nitropropane dioxygenase family)/NAD(P)-dependent dehydrogenase (short-subunit alcohol dehydrogenase family)
MAATVPTHFTIFVLNPSGCADPALALAGSRAGAVGVLNAETPMASAELAAGLGRLARAGQPFGLKWSGAALPDGWQDETARKPDWLILDAARNAHLLDKLQPYRVQGGRVLLETVRWHDQWALLDSQIDGWWVKGHESGGVVGEESTFVLLQRLLQKTTLPVYARGGIGLHSAAACWSGGAAGVVLDNQLLLARESPLADTLRPWLQGVDGTETVLVGREETADYVRVLERPGFAPVAAWRQRLLNDQTLSVAADFEAGVGWGDPLRQDLMPLGQDCAFAAPWAVRYGTVAQVLTALRRALRANPGQACRDAALAADAPLAQAHRTRFPIVQGAMTRVSDRAEFAAAVATAGALPMIALALLDGDSSRRLLEETRQRLGEQAWGVGILGFVPAELREAQLTAIRAVRPPFAYIAGGRPEQARQLEANDIPTYLHVPTPTLLRLFLEQGARRFIFEGRECGGHIGPLSSLVLWETMLEALVEYSESRAEQLRDIAVLLAGGIHDARSAAMVATLAAPLTRLGAHLGLLMGTAYILTEEAVCCGAIQPTFQRVVLDCENTVTLTTGPGHASRCAITPFVEIFHQTRRELQQQEQSARLVRDQLDDLTLGRLRLATKGLCRTDADPELHQVNPEQQFAQGMYMIGQVAALHDQPLTVDELHRQVSIDAMTWLAERQPAATPQQLPSSPADVAIIGIGVWLPGATDNRAYWMNLVHGVDCLQAIPSERWDWRLYYDPDPAVRDRIYAKWGGFIAEQPFDPTHYGLPPVALKSVDPLQLLTLETVRQAVTDAAIDLKQVDRERIAVILGTTGGMGELGLAYATRANLPRIGAVDEQALARLPEWTEDSFAGLLPNVAAGRVSNRLDFGGINCAVDAACASSLAAIYHAVNELRLGHSDLVISGGVDTMQSPFMYLCFAKTQALSPQGKPRTFDQNADGIAIAEGVAAVVLKRLADAERDGDRIYAVIKGIAGSSDGRAKGLTAPRPAGQLRALRRAYADAGYSPATVGLWEAHGTGTVAGDQAELETVSTLLAEVGASPASGAIGSVKSLIGHTKATAGVAGLVKAALALHYRTLPPHRGVSQPLAHLRETTSPLFISPEVRPWLRQSGQSRRASVSAFGFGGTNFHATLEEYAGENEFDRVAALPDWPAELFVWRGADHADLIAQLQALLAALQSGSQPRLAALAASLAQALPKHGQTLAIVARSLSALREQISTALNVIAGQPTAIAAEAVYLPQLPLEAGVVPALAVLFPGQGSQYPDMLRELAVALPPLRMALEHADAVLADALALSQHSERRLSRFIYPPQRFTPAAGQEARTRLTQTEVAQPALGTVEAGLWAWLQTLNLQPQWAAGHSYGEYVALHAAGVFDLDTLLHLSAARGRFIVEAAAGGELGTMLAARAPVDAVKAALAGVEGITLANYNAPQQLVLSGTAAAIEQARHALSRYDISVATLNVAAAFHSPLVEPARARLAAFMADQRFAAPKLTVYSNATTAPYPMQPAAMQALLAQHLTAPVNFAGEIEAMYAAGARLFLEVGPRDVLARLTRQILRDRPHQAVAIDDHGGGLTGVLHAVAALLANGVDLDLAPLFTGRVTAAHDLETVLAQSHPPPLASHVWLLSGHGVRRPEQPYALGLKPFLTAEPVADAAAPPLAARAGAPATTSSLEISVMSDNTSGPPSAPGPTGLWAADQALAGYQETMRQFLQLQERVMLAYFANSRDEGAVSAMSPPPATPLPLTMPAPSVAVTTVAPVVAPPMTPPVAAQAALPPTVPVAAPVTAASPTPVGQSLEPADLKNLLLKIVSERTGYPPEMLGLEQDIEADLGIDSIKRVEILGLFRRSLPAATSQMLQPHMEAIASLHTFQQILDAVAARVAGAAPSSIPIAVVGEGVRPFELTGTETELCAPLSRSVIKAHAQPLPDWPMALEPGLYLLTPDELGVADALSRKLRQAGAQPMLMPEQVLSDPQQLAHWLDAEWRETPIRAVIHLLPLGQPPLEIDAPLSEWRERIGLEVKTLFAVLQQVGPELRQHGRLLTVSGMGGRFGREATAEAATLFPGGAGLTGLVKTLNLEWNDAANPSAFIAKALDFDPTDDPEQLAEWVLRELTLPGGRREVGYPAGVRTLFRTVPASLAPLAAPLRQPDSQWVVLVTGGARGITAETLRELAAERVTLILLGRSPLPAVEDAAWQALTDAAALRRYFIQQAASGGQAPRPVDIERRVQAVLRDRETRANLADFAAFGATVDYRVLDVRDEAAFSALLGELYGQYGRIDAVIHGAGVIEDGWLLDKTPASIDRVIDTKIDCAFLLARQLRPESLQFLAFYTSVAGRFGNRGQADYATANEILNRLACQLAARWRGQVKVVAINWSPWDRTTHGAGMVTPAVRRQFEARGVHLVQAAAGRAFLQQELRYGPATDVELVAGDFPWEYEESRLSVLPGVVDDTRMTPGPWGLLHGGRSSEVEPGQWRFDKTVDLISDPYLDQHRLEGMPVLPFAMALEYMAQTVARLVTPGAVLELEEVSLLQGLRWVQEELPLRIEVKTIASGGLERQQFEVMLGRADGQTKPGYRATALVSQGVRVTPPSPLAMDAATTVIDIADAYRRWLFHGPLWQRITGMAGVGPRGFDLTLTPSQPRDFCPFAAQGEWLFDPAIIDALFQGMLVWSRALRQSATLPNRIGLIQRFSQGQLPAKLQAQVRIHSDLDHPVTTGDAIIIDAEHTVHLALWQFECTASTALNRLGGGWAGGRVDSSIS